MKFYLKTKFVGIGIVMSKLTNTLMALLLPVVILYGYFSLLNENEPQNVVEVTKSSLTDTEK